MRLNKRRPSRVKLGNGIDIPKKMQKVFKKLLNIMGISSVAGTLLSIGCFVIINLNAEFNLVKIEQTINTHYHL